MEAVSFSVGPLLGGSIVITCVCYADVDQVSKSCGLKSAEYVNY